MSATRIPSLKPDLSNAVEVVDELIERLQALEAQIGEHIVKPDPAPTGPVDGRRIKVTNADVRPTYLLGCEGEIVEKRGTKYVVRWDEKFHSRNPRLRRQWRMTPDSLEFV